MLFRSSKIKEKRDGIEGYGDGILSTPVTEVTEVAEVAEVSEVVEAPKVEKAEAVEPAAVETETPTAVAETPAAEEKPAE